MTLDALQSRAQAVRDAVLREVLAAADPAVAVRSAEMPVGFAPTSIIASGKGSAPMVEAAMARFGPAIRSGVVTCVPEHLARLRQAVAGSPRIAVYAADHPLPTERNLVGAKAIETCAHACAHARTDTLVLTSGGASAHITSPIPGISLIDLRETTDALLRAGATIDQLNTVRKHIETLKGGRLAGALAPARAHVLVLSDVLGDPLGTIGSGPTAPDPTTYQDACAVLDRFPESPIPESVRNCLEALVRSGAAETPKPDDPCFDGVSHAVIANNNAARLAAQVALETIGLRVERSKGMVRGEAREVAKDLVDGLGDGGQSRAIIFAGETTVAVGEAKGIGGRNQELALAAAILLEARPNTAVMTFATDGIDGPTDAAGALVTSETTEKLRAAGIDPHAAIESHDSHSALDSVGALIRTGPTGTNINDIAVAVSFGLHSSP